MTRDRALHHLKALRRDIDRVVGLKGEWFADAFLADDRIGTRAEWANMMDRFALVVRAHREGRLDRALTDELVAVAERLVGLFPTLERMQLRRPSSDDLTRVGVRSVA